MIAAIPLLATLTSCAQQNRHSSETAADAGRAAPQTRVGDAGTKPPSKHWIQNRQLSALMNEISAKMVSGAPDYEPRPRSDQTDEDVRKAIESTVKLADGLAASAERIPASVEGVQMSEADRAGFNAEAQTLRTQAIHLRDVARTGKTVEMQRAMSAIGSTCISCHSRYREFAGDINSARASTN
jgi:hypothetical protein